MILFGESLNVISTVIGRAYRERDPKPIQEEVQDQIDKRMDYIDINLGPAKKDGHELMPWVCQVVQEVAGDVPLLLDTSNIAAIEEGLKVLKPARKPHIVNSIMARPERYPAQRVGKPTPRNRYAGSHDVVEWYGNRSWETA